MSTQRERILEVLRGFWPESGGQYGHAKNLALQDACAAELLRVLAPTPEPARPDDRCISHNKDGRRCHGDQSARPHQHWAGASHFWTEQEGSDFVVFTVGDAKTRHGVVQSRDIQGNAVILENGTHQAYFQVLAGNWGPPHWVQ